MDEKSVGKLIIESAEYLALREGKHPRACIEVKTLLASGTWSAAPDYQPRVAFIQPYLHLRELMPNLTTSSNLVDAPTEATQTGGADYQTNEGDAKAGTDLTFSLGKFPVATIGTWVGASRQLVDDSQAFSGYIDTRLISLVQAKVEKEMLYGDGATGHITGLTINATVGGAGTTTLDKIGGALVTLATAGFVPDGIVMNPVDWLTIISSKTAGAVYPAGDPLLITRPLTLWGFPVALSNQIAVGHYLVGSFQTYSALFIRQNATVEISRNNQDYFIKNLLAILGEERLALAIYKPTAFVYGVT